MEDRFQNLFLDLTNRTINYLPNLMAGILLVLMGWFFAWFLKRLAIQILSAMNLGRYLTRFRWGEAFSKMDVRYGFYNFIGDVIFFVVFLVFLNFALITWDLRFLSSLLSEAISLFPRVASALLIFVIGWILATQASRAILGLLIRENLPKAMFIADYSKMVLILLFSAMALIQLNIAREIVIIGFSIIFVTLGVMAIILAVALLRRHAEKEKERPKEEAET
jgi:hypothetical protein